MRRPVWFRALISIWALWLSAALSEAPGIHDCPVHGGHAAHAGHAEHMANGSQSSVPADQSHHTPASCTCLGSCCCAAPVAAPTPSIELADEIVVAIPVAAYAHVASPVIHRAYSLPFSNGPPTL